MAETEASDDRFRVPAGLSRRRPVRRGHRLLLLRPRPDRAGELLQHRAGRHRRLPVRPPAGRPGHRPRPRRARACRPRSCRGCRRRPPRRSATRRGRWSRSTPKTGAVLAMVTSPTYDANEIASHDIEAANKAWTRAGQADDNRPLANRAAREIYPPGSTFKLVTAAAALEDGMSPDTRGDVAGPAQAAQHRDVPAELHQLRRSSKTTITNALRVSCNTAFANLGLRGRAGQAARAGAEVRLQRPPPRRSERRGQPVPRRDGPGAAGAEPPSASTTSRPARCRWRWSPPASPTTAR